MRPLTLSERGVATPTVSLSALLRGSGPEIAGETTARLADCVDEILASGGGVRVEASGGENEQRAKKATGAYRDSLERLWVLDPALAPGTWLPRGVCVPAR